MNTVTDDIDTELEDLRARKSKLEELLRLRSQVARLEDMLYIKGGDLTKATKTVLEVVSEHWRVSQEQITSRARPERYTIPRHLVFFILVKHVGASQSEVGRSFNRDHATIANAIKKVRNLSDTDRDFRKRLELVTTECASRLSTAA